MNKSYQKNVHGVKNAGFTLIELLVVVLIIGILAAVAVPQYEVAVDKSRFMTYIQLANSIKNAEEVFFLANGYYSPRLDDLDIEHQHACETALSALGNEWKCPDGFFIDVVSGNNQARGGVRVALCPDYNTGSSQCYANDIATVTIPFSKVFSESINGGCVGATARGVRICKSLGELVK